MSEERLHLGEDVALHIDVVHLSGHSTQEADCTISHPDILNGNQRALSQIDTLQTYTPLRFIRAWYMEQLLNLNCLSIICLSTHDNTVQRYLKFRAVAHIVLTLYRKF